MMNSEQFTASAVGQAIEKLYGERVEEKMIQIQTTRKDFEGDITAVMFALSKISKSSPEKTGEEIGRYLVENYTEVSAFCVVKGFLNISFSFAYWMDIFKKIYAAEDYGQAPKSGKRVMVEYSSPNTNKPLHLGHIRNNLLGWSVSKLLEANGHEVIKVNLVNDRGVHICKSMIAWERIANGETPESSGMKGDHLVGKYYVAFNEMLKKEVEQLKCSGYSDDEAERNAPILKDVQNMLVKWEQGDKDVVDLWRTMNSWVYAGFDKTYGMLGVSFDKIYYESDTYLLGKELVNIGLQNGAFCKREDGSVWCDLTSEGLDEKLLLRSDGTSVYMTQDLGTALERFMEYNFDELIYVVGNEQNYHFQVLKLILKKLGYEWAENIYHLSYGMVELPEGKMKSREGTVVDADELIDSMIETARETSLELGKLEDMDEEERGNLFKMLGLGALKYFIIKVDSKKTMLFDPKESIDFNGNTGPFIQYTHTRIKSIIRKAKEVGIVSAITGASLLPKEIGIIKILNLFPSKIIEAGNEHSPALIANYVYELAKEFNQYYHEVAILRESDEKIRSQRLALIEVIARVLKKATGILGISLPERM